LARWPAKAKRVQKFKDFGRFGTEDVGIGKVEVVGVERLKLKFMFALIYWKPNFVALY
jgi:hypothetical protein